MADPNYSFWSRTIHRMALANRSVAEASFDIERAVYRGKIVDVSGQAHVFVTGLARAGTTILMRQLHQTGAFRSLTYRDMPFVLAPNLWERISGLSLKQMAAEERAHGDSILVDFDSPEALEEVFWRVTCGDAYIRKDRLVPMTTDSETEQDFRDYVALLLMGHPGRRYLSKNNNNLLRLGTLARCFPKAFIVIPIRDPLQHAGSLMRQHRNFSDRHARDTFTRRYMEWLVHHEFGLDHRPFAFDDKPCLPCEWTPVRPGDLCYWLRLWIDVYRFVLKTAPKECIFLSYDRLCDDLSTWSRLCSKLGLPSEPPSEPFRKSHEALDRNASASQLEEAETLYKELLERAF